jgi:aromatic-L-amino-acid/L-tryptophan decarboxylase
MLSPRIRHLYAGIEHADSIVMDPHKWWFAPYDCGALLYRDPRIAKAIHTQHASYLDVIHQDDVELNPSDLAYHLTRRARGLPLWFSLAVNGLDAYRDAVEYGISLAEYAAERIRQTDYLELLRDPVLSVVLFRRRGWKQADYDAWSHAMLQEQVAFVTPTSWQGEAVGRLAFLHPSTTPEMIDEVLAPLAADPGTLVAG